MTTAVEAKPVGNILAIYHPGSVGGTSEQQLEVLVEYADSIGLPVNPVKSAKDFLGTVSLLGNNVDTNTRIVAISGDGVVHHTANAHDELGLDNGLATLGTGGANDIHTSLDPAGWHSRNPRSILASPLVEHRPLRINAEHESLPEDDRRRKLQAVAYFSIGFTADMSKRFNEEGFRKLLEGKSPREKLREQFNVVRSSIGPYDRPFTVSSARGDRQLNELVYPNGSRMAKFTHYLGLQLLEPGYGRIGTTKIDMSHVIMTAGRAATGLFTKFDPDHVDRFSVVTRDEDDILIQADGETYEYPSGTQFSIGLSDKPLPLATSRLRYQPELDLTSL